MEYRYAYDCETIVLHLTKILDYIDEHEKYIKCNTSVLIAELSISLAKRTNTNLLPYLYVIERYAKEPEKGGDIIADLFSNQELKN